MCTIGIYNILQGTDFPTAGYKLYDIIISKYDSEPQFTLDLTNVEVLPSIFLNASIGKLISTRGREALKKIRFTNITKSQADRIKDYVAKILA